MLKTAPHIIKQLNLLPNKPGVYLFRDINNKILYIGKASSLKKRVQSYFRKDSAFVPRIQKMISQVFKVDYIVTQSEIEALLLESKLIKRQHPKYNIEWKDGKNYLHIAIEDYRKTDFPRIFTSRKIQNKNVLFFGPFVDSDAVRKTLSFIRGVFPYRSCRIIPKRPCLWYHLQKCPAPCIKRISPKEYQRTIKQIILFLNDEHKKLIVALKNRMKKMVLEEQFEQAAKIRDKLLALEHINEVTVLQKRESTVEEKESQAVVDFVQKFFPNFALKPSFRVEGYDISNISGTATVGSMVVFIDGQKQPSEYRKFAIKTVKGADDVASMTEMLKRRLSHKHEWLLPDLMVLDGGKGQLKAARTALEEHHLSLPYLALAKKEEKIYIPGKSSPIALSSTSPVLLFFKRIRDEAHRFAKRYHHQRRKIDLFTK